MNNHPVTLNGTTLTVRKLLAIADGAPVVLDSSAMDVMQRSREILINATESNTSVYGVTTGLGPKVVEPLDNSERDAFSVSTIRGRAHAVGSALDPAWVRAGMAVRANTLLKGTSGVRPELATFLAECLNKSVTPVIPESGSIGVADLSWGGMFGSALIGEGLMTTAEGEQLNASEVLLKAGMEPFQPKSREGLALVSHSCISAALSALACGELDNAYRAAQTAAALSLEGFRANLSPIDYRVLQVREQAGQMQAAEQIHKLLTGSALFDAGAARRLQDPLSLRNIVQVHGSVQAFITLLTDAVTDEINGASDNPAVLVDHKEVLSHGGYLPVYLSITLNSTLQSMVHLAALQVSRIAKLLSSRFTDLSNGLTKAGAEGAGFNPVMKTAEALYAEIAHAATPAPIYPGISADGLEDVVTHISIPAKGALKVALKLRQLCAIELLVSAQSIDVRGIIESIAPSLQATYHEIRKTSDMLVEDRSLSGDIDTLATRIHEGVFSACDS